MILFFYVPSIQVYLTKLIVTAHKSEADTIMSDITVTDQWTTYIQSFAITTNCLILAHQDRTNSGLFHRDAILCLFNIHVAIDHTKTITTLGRK